VFERLRLPGKRGLGKTQSARSSVQATFFYDRKKGAKPLDHQAESDAKHASRQSSMSITAWRRV